MYKCKDTPVVALTANMVSGAKEMYEKEGFNCFLGKPIKPERLEELLKELLPVEGVDYEDALRHLGNASLVKKMIRDFWRIAPNDMEKLNGFYNGITRTATAGEEADESTVEKQDSAEEAVNYGDEAAEQYRILVHSMKNSTAMIGATTVSALAKILEYAARDRKTDVIERLHPVFAEEWLLLTEKLKKAYPAKNEEASTNIKSDKNDDSVSDDKKADKKWCL